MKAVLLGGPAPYREAIADRLAERGYESSDRDALDGEERHVCVVYCDCDENWELLAELAADPACVTVAIVPSLLLDLYIRALVAGAAGVVYVDTPSGITADAIQAAVGGEVILPRQAAQSIAALARREHPSSALDEAEQQLLRAVATGRTIVELADNMHYSERTVRRHLHSLYLKLGVRNRAEAIAYAVRLGLADGEE